MLIYPSIEPALTPPCVRYVGFDATRSTVVSSEQGNTILDSFLYDCTRL